MVDPTMQKIEAGIAAYDYEQRVLLRLLRFKGGTFTAEEFDQWFSRPPKRQWMLPRHHSPDSFMMLGYDQMVFTWWGLLQYLAMLGKVEIKSAGPGLVVYSLAGEDDRHG
jgi:hypothetical protein